MTAEIVIMNNQAVALAADSAVTMGTEQSYKIFQSASKIFSLSKYHPVGVMFYGNANFMGIPWETIVKIYRSQLGAQCYPSLDMYVDDFLSFLATDPTISSEGVQQRYVETSIVGLFSYLSAEIMNEVDQTLCNGPPLTDTGIKTIVSGVIKRQYETWRNYPLLEKGPVDYGRSIKKKYSTVIGEYKQKIFEKLPLSKEASRTLTNIAIEYFMRAPVNHDGISGLVITGFGDNEAFPSLAHYSIDGVAAGVLRRIHHDTHAVSPDMGASITPFAQSEMVVRFMDGVDPVYENTAKKYIFKILHQYPEEIVDSISALTQDEKKALKTTLANKAKKEFEDIEKELANFKKERFSNRVIKVVTMLPKEVLALMAESLVSLTSFKRKMSMEAETVGEPIDVAVISKGDGFVWIKRKRYFPPDLNQPFFMNYFRSAQDDKKREQRKKSSKNS